jgi:hypothetical protein
MKVRKNRGAVTPAQVRKGRRMAADWKWFDPDEFDQQLKLTEWPDPDFPDGILIECGNLCRIHFRAPKGDGTHPRRRRDTTITFSKPVARQSWLAFDPEHPGDRLYMLIKESACAHMAPRFWGENEVAPKALSEWAMLAGGRHAKKGYPDVMAKPVGVMTAVVYYTEKKDDGPSFYIHRMGEMSCYFPILCCDQRGRLWVCGGNYTSPTPGITD